MSEKYHLCTRQNVMEWKYEEPENEDTQVKYRYLNAVLNFSAWVTVLGYIPSLLTQKVYLS